MRSACTGCARWDGRGPASIASRPRAYCIYSLRGVAMETTVGGLVGRRIVSTPVFDEDTFDQDYFTKVSNYAGRYDAYNPSHKIAGYLLEIRRLRPDGTLLDAGCAFGRFLRDARRYFRCEGVDISAYALGLARERVRALPVCP